MTFLYICLKALFPMMGSRWTHFFHFRAYCVAYGGTIFYQVKYLYIYGKVTLALCKNV